MKNKVIQKRNTLLQKLAYIVRPFVVYMVVKTAAMLTLAILISSIPVSGIDVWVEQNSNMLSAVVNGLASVLAVCFLLEDFIKEAAVTGEIDIDAGIFSRLVNYVKNGFINGKSKWRQVLACAGLGIVCAFAFNLIISSISSFMAQMYHIQGTLGSQKYDEIEQIQYSVPVFVGIILYGIISPLVEEIVFRGIIFNRIKRFFSIKKAVIFSALLFGAFHANLPQFIYGTCMGAVMAICYERTDCFGAPAAFHMAANVSVFLAAGL